MYGNFDCYTRYSDCFRKIPPEKFLKRQLCFPVFRETDFHWRRIFPIRQFNLTFEPNKFDMPGISLSICFFFLQKIDLISFQRLNLACAFIILFSCYLWPL